MAVPLRIIATGGHSGLGFEALKTLLASPFAEAGCQLTLLAKNDASDRAEAAKRRLLEQAAKLAPGRGKIRVELQHMDLASLSSVRSAANVLAKELESTAAIKGIDILLLNAALAKGVREVVVDTDRASGRISYTADLMTNDSDSSIETTACVNHVAHLLLVKLLLPVILKNASNGRKTRLVFTGSSLHRTLKQLGSLDTFFGVEKTADAAWTLRETYALSKFLQLLGIRALHRKVQKYIDDKQLDIPAGAIEIVVVQPGFVPQTGLARESGLVGRLVMSYLLPWAPFATSLEDAGNYIARACYVELDKAFTEADESEGFTSSKTKVRAALLEVKSKDQQFGIPDKRTADIELQEKWWPSACGDL